MENNNRQGCRWVKASGQSKEDGWAYDADFLRTITEKVNEQEWGETLSMEEVEAVLKVIESIEPCATSSENYWKEVQKWKDKHYTAMQRIVELESAFAGAEEMVKDKIKKISEIEIILDQIGKDNAIAITAIENIYLAKLIEMRKERDGWKNSNDNSYDLWHEQEAENRELSKQLEYWKSLYKALEKYTEDPYQSLENYKAWQQLKLNQP